MATRKLILGSAASLFLSGAMIAAGPVLAQSGDPAEAYSAAKTQYDSELQIYNQKQQDYQRQRSDYNARLDNYQRALNAPPPARLPDAVATDEPDVVVVDRGADTTVVVDPDRDTTVVVNQPSDRTVVVTDPDPDRIIVADDFAQRLLIRDLPPLVRLEDIADVNYAFFNVPVLDTAGVVVGHFRRIEMKDPGDLVAVVTLNNSRRTISVLTEHVRIDPDRRVVISDLTAREIDLIPAGFPYG